MTRNNQLDEREGHTEPAPARGRSRPTRSEVARGRPRDGAGRVISYARALQMGWTLDGDGVWTPPDRSHAAAAVEARISDSPAKTPPRPAEGPEGTAGDAPARRPDRRSVAMAAVVALGVLSMLAIAARAAWAGYHQSRRPPAPSSTPPAAAVDPYAQIRSQLTERGMTPDAPLL